MKTTYFYPIIVLFYLMGCQAPASESETSVEAKDTTSYIPKYQTDWGKVEARILETWSESKVDSSTWQMKGSLTIPYSYFSIHSGRNVLFGWDTYFTNAGLLLVDRFAVYAKNAADNQLAEIEQVGYVPNASEPWALNRSQTPFLSMMIREVHEKGLADEAWLRKAYPILKKEYQFWTDTTNQAIESHQTSVPGLQRFYHHATEEEALKFYGQIATRFGFSDSLAKEKKLEMAEAWLAEAESGMDFTPRFENRCHQFIAVDLNANLYRYEQNFAWMVKKLKLKNEPEWAEKAEQRKSLMNQYCWNEERGLYIDYDFVNKRPSKVTSIASFYPLWAGLANEMQAQKTVENLPLFEYEFGPTICEKTEQDHLYQWDYPAGWPPTFYLTAQGLDQYGYREEAQRIAAKYLDLVTKNFLKPRPATFISRKKGVEKQEERTPGHVYEKYNVEDGTIYDAEYASRSFHGWSYGVYIWCLDYYPAYD